MPDNVLTVSRLTVAIDRGGGAVCPVDGVSLGIEAGECLCLAGESGSGKTTVVRAVAGLLQAGARVVSGEIVFRGLHIETEGAETLRAMRGKAIGTVFQEPMTALDPLMTAGAQVAEALTAHGVPSAWAKKRAVELLAEAGVADAPRVAASYPHQLSGGLRQRVLIAAALANRPALLLADEPTTALDVTVAAGIVDLLGGLRARLGMAVLLITHDVGVAARAAGRVAIMYAGQIVEHGATREVLSRPRHPYTAALLGAIPGRAGAVPGARLPAISGTVPDLSALPPGCRFEPRCGRRIARCAVEAPAMTGASGRGFTCFNPVDQ